MYYLALAFEEEKQHALSMLQGIELGLMAPEESFELLNESDPVLIHFIFKWIRKHYHRDHEQFEEVRERLTDVTNRYRGLTRKAKEGETDPIVDWFEGTHKYRELDAEEFIDLVVEKLEG